MRLMILALWMAFAPFLVAQDTTATHPMQAHADFLLEYMDVRYPGTKLDGTIVYVSVQKQKLFLIDHRMLKEVYTISTAAAGLGFENNSFRTPTGLHYARERIGQGLPAWSVLYERRPTGEVFDSTATPQGDLITSRIIRLAGMESGVNAGGDVDSYGRSIYIHGTADQPSLGSPSSHGCIRMRNTDVITLFDRVPVGALVIILDN